MKKVSKITAGLLALIMALSLAACSGDKFAVPTPNVAIPTPAETTAAPTPEPTPDAAALLDGLDMELFDYNVACDALTYHLNVSDPDNFPEITDVETGWGDFTYDSAVSDTENEKAWLERLEAIDRDALDENDQLTYDTLKQTLEWDIASLDHYYYGEVLDTLVGLHSNLPLNLVFYDMDSKEDVEGYLTLLADTPRYMGLVLQFEQEKSAAGCFMRDTALDEVLSQLQDFIDSRDTCFLLATFDEFTADIAELTDEERAAYSERNGELVNLLIDSYEELYSGLEALRGTATNEGGLCNYGDEGLAYFEEQVKYAACSDITVDEAMQILSDELDAQVDRMIDAATTDPTVWDSYDAVDLTVGTTEENLDYLETLMKNYYPELPGHTVTFMDCPSELEDQFSPAAYLIPPIDDPSENLIILNAKTLETDTRYLDTLAHEGYPGHMYHYQYLRTLVNETGYTRQALSLTGYYECWSQAGECFFDNYNTRFSTSYCNFMSANSFVGNLIFPAIASLMVNYYGRTEEDVADLLSYYYGDEGAAELAAICYQYAVENPTYFLEYALGFSIFQQEQRRAEEECGNNFSLIEYNRTFLNVGPTYFNFILPVLDEWIEANKAS